MDEYEKSGKGNGVAGESSFKATGDVGFTVAGDGVFKRLQVDGVFKRLQVDSSFKRLQVDSGFKVEGDR